MNDPSQLQPNQHEQQSAENEDNHFPDGQGLKPHPTTQNARRLPAIIDAGDDNRQDSRNVEFVAAEVSNVRRQK